MTHSFPTNAGVSNFYTTLIANDTFVANSFILTAITFPIFDWAKDAFIKKAVFFGPQGAVVNCFRLGNLAVRPEFYGIRGSQFNLKTVKVVYVFE